MNWNDVAGKLRARADSQRTILLDGGPSHLNKGQQLALDAIAERIADHGVLIADEVGMGKTRIAVEVVRAVKESGGRAVVLAPPGLGYQWRDELRAGGVHVPPLLRSLWAYFDDAWGNESDCYDWWRHEVLIVSHLFCNWRIRGSGPTWRWTLVPELYAQWRKHRTGRFPREYGNNDSLGWPDVHLAARRIVEAVKDGVIPVAQKLDALTTTEWRECFNRDLYTKGGTLRRHLEEVVGFGLGAFDLVVIDEAHKSRGEAAGLSTLLDSVLLQNPAARRLTITATPVELDSRQWLDSLKRLGIRDPASLDAIDKAIERYSRAIERVRDSWRSSPEARAEFVDAARCFETELGDYVLRRDKREDEAVKKFHAATQRPINQYRDETREIVIDPLRLKDLRWKRAVCAVEALSLTARQSEDAAAKRLRLMIGSGYGVSDVIARSLEQEDEASNDDKRAQRRRWWTALIAQAASGGALAIFDHPPIVAAVNAIEAMTRTGEKVLVFGRYTKPLRALESLLNAREMLRRVAEGEAWPQTKVHGRRDTTEIMHSEWPAVEIAYRQWREERGADHPVGRDELDKTLSARYDVHGRQSQRVRTALAQTLREALQRDAAAGAAVPAVRRLLSIIRHKLDKGPQSLSSLIGALAENLGDAADGADHATVGEALFDLLEALLDRSDDECDEVGDAPASDESDSGTLGERDESTWRAIEEALEDEYSGRTGGFARFMYGNTKPTARRVMQQAFNRSAAFPRVLVAQSQVGREGLNLHKACRTVILLHPEWNPAVVEQQIGRVDRVQSHWAKQLDLKLADDVPAQSLPRIEFRPVVFKGTYDEYHWQVLRERWDDLRAQLHGVPLPERIVSGDLTCEEKRTMEELIEAAPCFSPTVRGPGRRRARQ